MKCPKCYKIFLLTEMKQKSKTKWYCYLCYAQWEKEKTYWEKHWLNHTHLLKRKKTIRKYQRLLLKQQNN